MTYPCPCCGFLVLEESLGSYEICRICGWEDDEVQQRWPGYRGGANVESLCEAQVALSAVLAPRFASHTEPGVIPTGARCTRPSAWEQIVIRIGHRMCTTGIATGRSNVSLQLTSARSSEALRLSAYRDAIARNLASRILSRSLAAELWR